MMKKVLFSVVAALAVWTLNAQTPQKLSFRSNGEFKIVQVADMHLGTDMSKNRIVEEMLTQVIESEMPDLIVFTGDNTTLNEVQEAWDAISSKLAAYKIPWTAVLGNHDDEYAVSRKEIERIIRKSPYCVMQNVPEGVAGECNQIVPIYGSGTAKNKASALLYGFDAHSYSPNPLVKGYGWVDSSQIDWYRKESKKFTQQNGGNPLPALAFFHIPLPEYKQAWESFDTRRFGDRNEPECSPQVNSGLFASLLECGDVMGTFVGHDHINDYIACLYNIALAYGRASGGENTYGDKTPGARVIVLKEGKREFDTWLRERGNPQPLNSCTYPTSLVRKN